MKPEKNDKIKQADIKQKRTRGPLLLLLLLLRSLWSPAV